jgi:putative ABC transport system permease protein
MRVLLRNIWSNFSSLVRHNGFKALLGVIVLAVGASSMIFSNKAETIRQQARPMKSEGRVVMLWTKIGSNDRVQTSPADFAYWREQNKVFEEMGAFSPGRVSLTEGGGSEKLYRGSISASLLPVLGVKPLLGRNFLPSEDRPGEGQVVILSHGFWQRRFNSDPNITAKTVSINGANYKVVGVMPADFNFPRESDIPAQFKFPKNIEVWTPLAYDPSQLNRGFRFLVVAARLKPNVSIEQAQAEMTSISRRLQEQFPRTNNNLEVTVVPLPLDTLGQQ